MTAAGFAFTAYEHGPAVVHATVLGIPVPQGSIRSLGRGRPSIHSNMDKLGPWRERLHFEFLRRTTARDGVVFPLAGPISVDVTFTLPKPKTAPKKRRVYPASRPDCDKLVRAVGDALESAAVVSADAQIVEWHARKVFPGEHPLALNAPGALVYVYQVGAS